MARANNIKIDVSVGDNLSAIIALLSAVEAVRYLIPDWNSAERDELILRASELSEICRSDLRVKGKLMDL